MFPNSVQNPKRIVSRIDANTSHILMVYPGNLSPVFISYLFCPYCNTPFQVGTPLQDKTASLKGPENIFEGSPYIVGQTIIENI